MIEPGAVVAEKYWVERVLGRGGMGVVVAATHLTLGQRVALKFLRPEAARDGELVERFLREARAAVRLRGEHVGKVVDVGTLPDGLPYIVMEFLEGHDLASALARGGPLPVPVAVDYVLQACAGLVEAHAAGLVHRDLKPANLFLTRRPDGTPLVKVMDFGIAKAIGRMDAAITESATVMGSPGYMSPEQLRSARDVDQRADIWSLGVVLYELVSGRRPFEAQTITELAVMLATEPVPPLPVPAPRGFAAAIMRCLEKEPSRRWRDVAALATALAPFGSPGAAALAASIGRVQAGVAPPAAGPAVEAMMSATTLTRATSVRQPAVAAAGPFTVRRRRTVAALGVAIAGVVAAIAIVVASGGAGSAAAPVDAAPAVAPAVAPPAPDVAAAPVDAGVDAPVSLAPLDVGDPDPGSRTHGGGGGRPRREAVDAGPRAVVTGSGSGSGAGSAAPTGGSGTASAGSGRPGSGSGSAGTGAGSGTASPGTGRGSGRGSATPSGIPDDTDGDGIPDKR